jgi:hypothetical protein
MVFTGAGVVIVAALVSVVAADVSVLDFSPLPLPPQEIKNNTITVQSSVVINLC